MTSLLTRTAKSARRHIGLTLLAVLAIAGSATYVYAASSKAGFTLTVNPTSQTITQGQSASFTASLTKTNGFAGPVALSVSGLPAGAKASFSPNPVVVGQSPGDKGTLTVQTNVGTSTPAGAYTLTLKATSGGLVQSAATTLVVQPAASPNFALAATPATQTVPQSGDTNYQVTLSRSGGFSGAVSLSATGLPAGATATFSPTTIPAGAGTGSSTVVVTTSNSTPTGNHTLTLRGTGQVGGSAVTRTTAVTLVVDQTRSFTISGDLPAGIGPAQTRPLDLTLTNPNRFDLKVTGIAVTVNESTTKPGCSGTENFRIRQIPPQRYPIVIARDETRTLSQLGVAAADRPQVSMLNLPEAQNDCLGATFGLAYSGTATK